MADAPPRTESFAFLLLPGFTLVAFASAVEPLRLANLLSGQRLYTWRTVGEGETGVRSSVGVNVATDTNLTELDRDTTIIVVGGSSVKSGVTKPVLTWLRRHA
ncbi:MAG: GlxA family transcriptional regulator, partial [Pseudomonadota bacterium]